MVPFTPEALSRAPGRASGGHCQKLLLLTQAATARSSTPRLDFLLFVPAAMQRSWTPFAGSVWCALSGRRAAESPLGCL